MVIPESADVSPDLEDLLKGILEKDPKKRFTLEQLKVHKWVNKGYEDEQEAYCNQTHESVSVSDTDVKNAFTKISSVAALTRLKIKSNKWSKRARKNLSDARLKLASMSSSDIDIEIGNNNSVSSSTAPKYEEGGSVSCA